MGSRSEITTATGTDFLQLARMVIKVTNFPKFLRDIRLKGHSDLTQMEEKIVTEIPETLEEFFDKYPELRDNNLDFTATPHTPLKRDGVLFLTQRRQATSDIRENPKVTIIGSHAAKTCQIVVMRHTESGVASLGHFDNFSCWQFGESSPPKEDLQKGHIQVSVFGGYVDKMGHAIQNSRALLTALQENERTIEMVHFCVGPYNTTKDEKGENCAILIGIAIELESGIIFPAEFPWNNFEDFSTQLKDRVSRRRGEGALLSDDDKHKTKLSTFKPKALRNPNTYKNLQSDSKEKDKKG